MLCVLSINKSKLWISKSEDFLVDQLDAPPQVLRYAWNRFSQIAYQSTQSVLILSLLSYGLLQFHVFLSDFIFELFKFSICSVLGLLYSPGPLLDFVFKLFFQSLSFFHLESLEFFCHHVHILPTGTAQGIFPQLPYLFLQNMTLLLATLQFVL